MTALTPTVCASCPACGEVRLAVGEIFLGSCTTGAAYCEFVCPVCDREVYRLVCADCAVLLRHAGVTARPAGSPVRPLDRVDVAAFAARLDAMPADGDLVGLVQLEQGRQSTGGAQ